MKETLRLNRFLAAAGIASRRRCDDLIRQGRILVNGSRVEQLGTRVDPGVDEVLLDGARIRLPESQVALVLNKPREVLVASGDPRGRRTVMDLLEDCPVRVFPVGRLDYRSEGLLVFTNDGELAYRLAHPRFKVEKQYDVVVEGIVAPEVLDQLAAGVTLDDGPTQPAHVRLVSRSKGRSRVEVRLREGRKRQIRRMFSLFGHSVVRLRRVRFGPLELGELEAGKWRSLEESEVRVLRRAAGLDPVAGEPA